MASDEQVGETCQNCMHESVGEHASCSRPKCDHKFCRPFLDKMPNLVDSPKRKRKKIDERPNHDDRPKPKREKSKLPGEICHHCRTRSEAAHVRCSTPKCKHKFCRACLLNRYGENIDLERAENVRWVCPKCRGGCGEGCVKSCCNCSTCRKARKLEATGDITVKIAHKAGFTNVHDYIVHLQTRETPTAIADRKKGRGWTSIDFLFEDVPAFVADKPSVHEPRFEDLATKDHEAFLEDLKKYDYGALFEELSRNDPEILFQFVERNVY